MTKLSLPSSISYVYIKLKKRNYKLQEIGDAGGWDRHRQINFKLVRVLADQALLNLLEQFNKLIKINNFALQLLILLYFMCYLKYLPILDSLEAIEQKAQESSPSLSATTAEAASSFLKNYQPAKQNRVSFLGTENWAFNWLPLLLKQLKCNFNQISLLNQNVDQIISLKPDLQLRDNRLETKPLSLLLNKLFKSYDQEFGLSTFSYKFSLQQRFPEKIYRGQRIKLTIKLVGNCFGNSAQAINSNPLDICIGVFDCQGNWVTQNLKGEPIISGVTCTELYRGKAEFTKICLQEISSNLAEKKISLVVYAKPGIKKPLPGDKSFRQVKWHSIKPSIFKNITVLSKKSSNVLKLFDD